MTGFDLLNSLRNPLSSIRKLEASSGPGKHRKRVKDYPQYHTAFAINYKYTTCLGFTLSVKSRVKNMAHMTKLRKRSLIESTMVKKRKAPR